jgi:hypothetical protein
MDAVLFMRNWAQSQAVIPPPPINEGRYGKPSDEKNARRLGKKIGKIQDAEKKRQAKMRGWTDKPKKK